VHAFTFVWYSAVGCTVVAVVAHLIAERELRDERPTSPGLGWFGPGPQSRLGRRAYLFKRLLTACMLVLAVIAVVLGGPP
jgi:hypothetical protein